MSSEIGLESSCTSRSAEEADNFIKEEPSKNDFNKNKVKDNSSSSSASNEENSNANNNMNNSLCESLNESSENNNIKQQTEYSNADAEDYELEERPATQTIAEPKIKYQTHVKQNMLHQDPYEILKKLEAIKELKTKTMNIQQIKSKMVEEVDSIETETKYLHNFQIELDLLIQEKLVRLEELRQIQNDILNLEGTIKQTQDEKKRAIESVRRLHNEYKPLKDEINNLRKTIGLAKTEDGDDNQIIESFLNKLHIINENQVNSTNNSISTSLATHEKSNKTMHHGKSSPSKKDHLHNSNSPVLSSSSSSSNSIMSSSNLNMNANSQKFQKQDDQTHLLHHPAVSMASTSHHLMEQLAKSASLPPLLTPNQLAVPNASSIDISAQLATMASLMAHSYRAQSPTQFAATQHFTNFLLNQSKLNNANSHLESQQQPVSSLAQMNHQNHHSHNHQQQKNTELPPPPQSQVHLSSIQPPFRQQPPPMKSCLSCNQQIHRNAPICPLCKAKSRSRNPKKPKKKNGDNSPNSP